MSIIPYGQTTERFSAVTKEDIAAVRSELNMDGSLALVNVSRLLHRKGHIYLFEAFAEILKDGIDAKLYLVGDGDYRAHLEVMCAKLGISERVNFLGWRSDALAVLAASDLVVHPSLEDALASVLIEAVMLERPIVATDISGATDTPSGEKIR
ncbi:MAG: glycosyltransferase [Chloracidobacterium sp.]|nr:glycosyltransferase [Chloracidobacterium sp.]